MHHPAIDQRHTREEHHPDRYGAPAERCRPRMGQLSAGHEDQQTAERTEHKPGSDRDMDRTPPGRVREDRRSFLKTARWYRMKQKADRNEDARDREDVPAGPRRVRIAEGHSAARPSPPAPPSAAPAGAPSAAAARRRS